MLKRIILAMSIALVIAPGVAFAGQNTGGDKNKVTTGLNPQPLPPGRRHYHRGHHKHHKHIMHKH